MKKLSCYLFACIFAIPATAQVSDTINYNYGIWQAFGDVVPSAACPQIRGRLCNFRWADLETSPNVWNWTEFDKDLSDRAKDNLPIIFMVYTKDDAPDWLYTQGVPKVIETDSSGTVTGYSPYYADTTYKTFFKRMITTVRQHVEKLPGSVRRQIIGVQACFGNTGDYINYKGKVPKEYKINADGFFNLFKEFSEYYYNEYKNTHPRIHLLSNPGNNGSEQNAWLLQNCPGGWIKVGHIGKGFQLNDELTKAGWLYNTINLPQSGSYVRCRSEIIGGVTDAGWWLKAPAKNMFALMCYDIYWGLDWNNQGRITEVIFDSAYRFFNKYAGQKDPVKSTNAMCAFKDAIDASDTKRFPTSVYGDATKTEARFKNVLAPFVAYGARLEDVTSALFNETDNLRATGTNDVGWDIFPGNYDRWVHQIDAKATSAGYWNVQSADTNSMYGRFARGFDLINNKDAIFLDVDDAFLGGTPLNSKYPVTIEITYLDKGKGCWQLFYDAQNKHDQSSIQVTCKNSGLWKKVSVTLKDAYFGNRGVKESDFYIKSTNNENVLFAVVELSRRRTASKSNVRVNESFTTDRVIARSNISLGLKVQAMPNPSPANFNLIITSKSNEPASIIVTDMSGRKVYTCKGSISDKYSFGKDFTPGTYIIQVTQGTNIQALKVVKER